MRSGGKYIFKVVVVVLNFSVASPFKMSLPTSRGLPAVARIRRPLYDSAGKDGGCTSMSRKAAWFI